MKINTFLSTLFFMFFAFMVVAQPGRHKQSWDDNYRIAQELLAESSYYNATEYLIRALEQRGDDDINLLYLIAKTFRQARNYENSAYYFGLVKEQDTAGKFKDASWHHAQMLKQNGDHQKAITEFKELEKSNPLKAKLARAEIKGCELAMSGRESQVSDVALMSEINSNYTEYAPMPLDSGGLVYSSLNSDDLIYTERKMVYSQIFKTSIIDGDATEKGTPMAESINKPDFHNGHGTYSDDGKKFYFTRCESKPDRLPDCNIYISTLQGTKWSEAREMGANINARNSSSSTPYFKEGKLYFSSDRSGSFGGMDIWIANANSNGTFSYPENAGRYVNSERDEITPFYDEVTSQLFFSSNGHVGYGGFDIYKAVQNGSIWTGVENMLFPMNSPADDMYFAVDATGERGYFSSNRVGTNSVDNKTCCDDIFTAALDWDKPQTTTLEGIAFKQGDPLKNPLNSALIELFELDNNGNRTLLESQVTQSNLPYRFELDDAKKYVIKGTKPGFKANEQIIVPKGSANIKADLGLGVDCIVLKGVVYVDDSKRKEVLVDAIVKLVETNVMGEEIVIAQTITTTEGYELCAPMDKKLKMIISKDGVLTDSYSVNTNGASSPTIFNIVTIKDQLNVGIKIDNILYDFNSSYLRPESKLELNKIYSLMQLNPAIILEIGAHTDNKGSVDYNLLLSQKRAKSCVDFLLSKGIPSYRLEAKGYGELQPIAANRNPDGSDNPSGRQNNRRTEFKIVGKLK
jgi:outer membrane protein OmpA-like peptidoglycan-associated protein/tetratricopeptide (TPR) repeat protein